VLFLLIFLHFVIGFLSLYLIKRYQIAEICPIIIFVVLTYWELLLVELAYIWILYSLSKIRFMPL